MKKLRPLINIGLIGTLTIMTVVLLFSVSTTDYILEIRHYFGIIFTGATIGTFFYNKNLFRLALFGTLFIGNFCGLSSLLFIYKSYNYISIGSIDIPYYWGQPTYSLILVIFIIFNSGFFIGIMTKEYWRAFLTRTHDLEPVITVVNVQPPTDNQQNKTNASSADKENGI